MLNNHSENAIIKPGPPGATMVDLFPIRTLAFMFFAREIPERFSVRFIPTFLPWTSFKKEALDAREALDEMSTRPFKMVKEQRVSLCPKLLELPKQNMSPRPQVRRRRRY